MSTKKAINTKEIGKMIYNKEKEKWSLKTETNMRAIGIRENNKAKEYISILMVIITQESGIMAKNTEMVFLYGK